VRGAHRDIREHVVVAAHAEQAIAPVTNRPQDQVVRFQPREGRLDVFERDLRRVRGDQDHRVLAAPRRGREETILALAPASGALADDRGTSGDAGRLFDLGPATIGADEPGRFQPLPRETSGKIAQEGDVEGDRRVLADRARQPRLDQARPWGLGGDVQPPHARTARPAGVPAGAHRA